MLTLKEDTMLGDVPDAWDAKPLNRLLSADYPGDWGDERGAQMTRVLRSTNLTNDGHLDLSDVALRALPARKVAFLEPKKNDILLERSGGGPGQPVGRVGFVTADMHRHAFSNFLHLLRPDPNEIEPRFLAWVLYQVNRTGRIVRLEQQTTQMRNLHFRDYLTMPVPVPPPDEQAAIARILDAVDTALERARAAVQRARELDHSLLHELLEKGLGPKGTNSGTHPPSWIVRRVDEVAEVGSGVTLGKDVSGFQSVELPYLRVANVQDGHLDLSTIKTVRVRVDEVENYRLEVGDVLMTEGGDIDKLGRGTIWEGQIPDCLHQNHIFRIRTNRKLLDPAFYALVVESDIAKRYFNRVAKRTTNLASTNKTQVRAFRFPVPPTVKEQQDIVRVMKASKATIAVLIAKQVALAELKKSLMHDLLTGRVRVRDVATVAAL
ncbi:MAG TPA: restriction endonuclease subunit S [Burkholderiales bacterium]|nr:restriction endonuclease subunit S [Burkholderiales bacterium]